MSSRLEHDFIVELNAEIKAGTQKLFDVWANAPGNIGARVPKQLLEGWIEKKYMHAFDHALEVLRLSGEDFSQSGFEALKELKESASFKKKRLKKVYIDISCQEEVYIDEAHIIDGDSAEDPEHFLGWYSRKIEEGAIEENEWSGYYKKIRAKFDSKKIADSVKDFTEKIANRLGDPSRTSFSRKGMVIGNIQSGKTANMVGLIARALDAGYKDIIILAGGIGELRRQTQSRLVKDLSLLVRERGVTVVTGSGRGGDWTPDRMMRDEGQLLASQNNPFVYVIKKNKAPLNALIDYSTKIVARASTCPALIIDDECDHFSIDRNANNANEDSSTINRKIRKLVHAYRCVTYVGYTATPFANIFINQEAEEDEIGEDLFPKDFITCLPTPDNYIGLEKLFGYKESFGDKVHKILDELPEDYNESLDREQHIDASDVLAWLPARVIDEDKEPRRVGGVLIQPMRAFRANDKLKTSLPPNLKRAINYFLIGVAVKWSRGHKEGEQASMMIHPTTFTEVHGQIRDQVNEYLERTVDNLSGGNSEEWGSFQGMWQEEFAPKTKEFVDLKKDPSITKLDRWEDIKKNLEDLVSRGHSPNKEVDEESYLHVRVINGNTRESENLDEQFWKGMEGKALIMIGGHKLSRGLTIEGLMMSFFLKYTMKPAYDTLLQAGRWFGYRKGYRDLCRLYIGPNRIFKFFKGAFEVDEEVRSQINNMDTQMETAEQGEAKTPRDVQLWVREKHGYRITAREKMATGVYTRSDAYWGQQTGVSVRSFSYASSFLNKNVEAFKALLKNIKGFRKEHESGYLFENVPKDAIVEFLGNYEEPMPVGRRAEVTFSIERAMLSPAYREYSNKWKVYIPFGKSENGQIELYKDSEETVGFVNRGTGRSPTYDKISSTVLLQGVSAPGDMKVLQAQSPQKNEAWLLLNLFRIPGDDNLLPYVGPTYLLPESSEDDTLLQDTLIATDNQLVD